MKQKKFWILAAVVLLAAVLLAVMLPGKDHAEQPGETQETQLPDITVETPYGTLYFPGKWQDRIRTEVSQTDVVTVSFYGKNVSGQECRLFDVLFGEAEGAVLGTIQTDTGVTSSVGLRLYEADPGIFSTDAELYEFDAMQEAVNYLIERLPLEDKEKYAAPESSAAVVQNQRPAVYADVLLETPYVTVAYPGELAGQLHVDMENQEPYGLTFCWNNNGTMVRLFKLAFDGEEESLAGYLKDSGKPVHLTVFDLAEEAQLNPEELDVALSLQESLNDILAKLPIQSQPVEEVPCITFETPYGTLRYPEEYQQKLEVEVSETDGYALQFRFLSESGEAVAMFDVVFGGAAGTPVGHYTGEDGSSVTVSLVAYSIASGGLLSDAEEELYYLMAEGANFLLEQYESMYPFEQQ